MAYRPRSAWTSVPPRYVTPLTPAEVQGVAIHWNGPAVPNVSTAAYLRGIMNYHRAKGWADVAYNFAVDQKGDLWELRGVRARSGANGSTSANRTHVAILACIGEGQRPTAAMLQGIRDAVALVRATYPNARAIRTHNQVRPEPTACPGPDLSHAVNTGALEPRSAPQPTTPKPADTLPEVTDMPYPVICVSHTDPKYAGRERWIVLTPNGPKALPAGAAGQEEYSVGVKYGVLQKVQTVNARAYDVAKQLAKRLA